MTDVDILMLKLRRVRILKYNAICRMDFEEAARCRDVEISIYREIRSQFKTLEEFQTYVKNEIGDNLTLPLFNEEKEFYTILNKK